MVIKVGEVNQDVANITSKNTVLGSVVGWKIWNIRNVNFCAQEIILTKKELKDGNKLDKIFVSIKTFWI